MAELIYYEDSMNLSCFYPGDQMCEQVVHDRVDAVAHAGVTNFVQNINVHKTNYPSKVWQSYWEGFDPDGPNDQAFFRDCMPDIIVGHRRWIEAFAKLARLGIDYVQTNLTRARQKGMSAGISVRMNDHHHTIQGESPALSRFWREHPQFRRHPQRILSREFNTWDWAHAEVRQHYRKLIDEAVQRYDIDSFELDFISPFVFKIGRELKGSKLMTAWVREIRKLVDTASDRWGHPVPMGVRVPSDPTRRRASTLPSGFRPAPSRPEGARGDWHGSRPTRRAGGGHRRAERPGERRRVCRATIEHQPFSARVRRPARSVLGWRTRDRGRGQRRGRLGPGARQQGRVHRGRPMIAMRQALYCGISEPGSGRTGSRQSAGSV